MRQAVIVGASAAGMAAADGLREGGWEGRILVLGEELDPPYDRTMLSKGLLADGAARPLMLRTEQQLAERDITLLPGVAARGLDIDRRLVVTSDGDAIPYDAVVVATGSRPRAMTTTAGVPLPVLRNLGDLVRLRDLTAATERVALIGAGLIGLEIAATLRARQIPVTVIGTPTLPLADQLGAEVATWLWGLHEAHGVDGRLGTTVSSVGGEPGAYEITLGDGSSLRCDVVLVAIGVVASDRWLVGSGVALRDGVLCDAGGRTNVPDVWAAGDVARVQHGAVEPLRFGHWTNAVEHGRQVGLNIARGEATAYHGIRSFWTEQYGHTIRSIGTRRPGDTDETVEGEAASGEFLVVHGAGDAFHAVTACGRDRSLRTYRKSLLQGAALSDARALADRQRG